MGFNISMAAVRGRAVDEIHAALRLCSTNETESEPESPVVAALLPSGWYLVYFNDRGTPSASDLATLSGSGMAIVLEICEMVTSCKAAGWQDARQRWSISYDAGVLQAEGDLPDCFEPVKRRLSKQQAKSSDIDHVFNVPGDVVDELIGFRYDGDPDGYPAEDFVVLERIKPNRKWWRPWY
jgi:hypothetical protein